MHDKATDIVQGIASRWFRDEAATRGAAKIKYQQLLSELRQAAKTHEGAGGKASKSERRMERSRQAKAKTMAANAAIFCFNCGLPGHWKAACTALARKTISIEVEGSDTVSEVKKRIQEEEGTAVGVQQLMFFGRRLDQGFRTLSHYNVDLPPTLRLLPPTGRFRLDVQFKGVLMWLRPIFRSRIFERRARRLRAIPRRWPSFDAAEALDAKQVRAEARERSAEKDRRRRRRNGGGGVTSNGAEEEKQQGQGKRKGEKGRRVRGMQAAHLSVGAEWEEGSEKEEERGRKGGRNLGQGGRKEREQAARAASGSGSRQPEAGPNRHWQPAREQPAGLPRGTDADRHRAAEADTADPNPDGPSVSEVSRQPAGGQVRGVSRRHASHNKSGEKGAGKRAGKERRDKDGRRGARKAKRLELREEERSALASLGGKGMRAQGG